MLKRNAYRAITETIPPNGFKVYDFKVVFPELVISSLPFDNVAIMVSDSATICIDNDSKKTSKLFGRATKNLNGIKAWSIRVTDNSGLANEISIDLQTEGL